MPNQDHPSPRAVIQDWLAKTVTRAPRRHDGSSSRKAGAANISKHKLKNSTRRKGWPATQSQGSETNGSGTMRPVGIKQRHRRRTKAVLESTESSMEEAYPRLLEVCSELQGPVASSEASHAIVSLRQTQPQCRTNTNIFERRARHKTREDRYEPKVDPKQRKRTGSQHTREAPTKRKRKSKSGANMMHDFEASNVARNRITLNPTRKHGIFGNGKASSPVKPKPVADLVFSELDFLNKRRDREHRISDDGRRGRRSKQQQVDGDAEISRYFGSYNGTKATKGLDHVKPSFTDIPELAGEDCSLVNVSLPDRPFLGFGSSGSKSVSSSKRQQLGIQRIYKNTTPADRSQSDATSHFTWTCSLKSSKAPYPVGSPGSCHDSNLQPRRNKQSLMAPESRKKQASSIRSRSYKPDAGGSPAARVTHDTRASSANKHRESSQHKACQPSGVRQNQGSNGASFKQYCTLENVKEARSMESKCQDPGQKRDEMPLQSQEQLSNATRVRERFDAGSTQLANIENLAHCQGKSAPKPTQAKEIEGHPQVNRHGPHRSASQETAGQGMSLDMAMKNAIKLETQMVQPQHEDQPQESIVPEQVLSGSARESYSAYSPRNRSIRNRRAGVNDVPHKHMVFLKPLFARTGENDAAHNDPSNLYASQQLKQSLDTNALETGRTEFPAPPTSNPASFSNMSTSNFGIWSMNTLPRSISSRSRLQTSHCTLAQRLSSISPFAPARVSRGGSAGPLSFSRHELSEGSSFDGTQGDVLFQRGIDQSQLYDAHETSHLPVGVTPQVPAPAEEIDRLEAVDQPQQADAEMLRFWTPNKLY